MADTMTAIQQRELEDESFMSAADLRS